MQIGMIKGATRIIGKSQGYIGLPLRDITIDDTVNGPGTPAMETAWFPTPKEMDAINAGAPIILRIIGAGHPPVMLLAGDTPEDADRVKVLFDAQMVAEIARMLTPNAYDDPTKGAFERAFTSTSQAASIRHMSETLASQIIEKVRAHG